MDRPQTNQIKHRQGGTNQGSVQSNNQRYQSANYPRTQNYGVEYHKNEDFNGQPDLQQNNFMSDEQQYQVQQQFDPRV